MESPVQIMLWDGMAQAVVLKFIDHATRKIETGRKIIIRSITVEYMLMMRITTRTFFISNKGFRIYGRHVQREIFIFWSHDIFPSYRKLMAGTYLMDKLGFYRVVSSGRFMPPHIIIKVLFITGILVFKLYILVFQGSRFIERSFVEAIPKKEFSLLSASA